MSSSSDRTSASVDASAGDSQRVSDVLVRAIGDDSPVAAIRVEDGGNDGLDEAVRAFSDVSLLEFAVDEVAIDPSFVATDGA